MKKVLLAIIFLLFFSPKSAFAQESFLVDANSHYAVSENGETQITLDIAIENTSNAIYAESYVLNLIGFSPENIELTKNSDKSQLNVTRENNNYKLLFLFDDTVVGLGKKRNISITFSDKSFAKKTGEVWEVQIPKLSDVNTFRDYNVILSVPSSFGQNAFISPKPDAIIESESYIEYQFTSDRTPEKGISLGFGEFQVFTISLNYHLENPLGKPAETKIALPPDTSFQRLYYTNLEPKPEKIEIDPDGNWMASYQLKAREKIDVNVFASVQLFSSPINYVLPSPQVLYENTLPTEYWQSDDPEIMRIANDLITPKRIYEYVINTLNYDYNRVKPNIQRYGARDALINKESAICMEYTDLFIALARAAGIPAREVNGYAYTENPEIQPLSLVADVLHAWPEYWDREKNIWIPVDPTWGDTTGGVDYFSKLDLRHITFVNHGTNPQLPYPPGSYKLGPEPKKDIFVSFGLLPDDRNQSIEIVAEKKSTLPLTKTKLTVQFKNKGTSAYYGLKPAFLFDEELVQENYIEIIPPFSFTEMDITIPYSLLGTKTPDNMVIVAGNQEVSIKTFKSQLILVNIITILSILIFCILIILHKSGKLDKYYRKIAKLKYVKRIRKVSI